MKGVVLAGGTGSRLFPITRVTNKHLLPVFDKPMVYYPIQTLVNAGITEILLVTGGKNAGDFLRLLGNGKHMILVGWIDRRLQVPARQSGPNRLARMRTALLDPLKEVFGVSDKVLLMACPSCFSARQALGAAGARSAAA